MIAVYYWRELPQVSFLSRRNFCCDKITYVVTKYFFVASNTCLLRKHTFAATKDVFKHVFSCFVVTKMIFVAAPANDIICQIEKDE